MIFRSLAKIWVGNPGIFILNCMVISKFPIASIHAFCPPNVNLYHYRKMQQTLHFTRQQYSRASSSTPSSSNSQSMRPLSSLVAYRLCKSTLFAIKDMSEPNKQNDSILQESPPAGQNYGCIFPIDWKNLFLGKHSRLTGHFGYWVINKWLVLKTAFISPIWKYGADLFWDGLEETKKLWLCKICHLA